MSGLASPSDVRSFGLSWVRYGRCYSLPGAASAIPDFAIHGDGREIPGYKFSVRCASPLSKLLASVMEHL